MQIEQISPRLARHRVVEKALRKFSPMNCGKSSQYKFKHAFTFMDVDTHTSRTPTHRRLSPVRKLPESTETPVRYRTPDFPRRMLLDLSPSAHREFPLLSIKIGESHTPENRKWSFTPTSKTGSHLTDESVPTVSTADNTFVEELRRKDGAESSEAASPVLEPRYETRELSPVASETTTDRQRRQETKDLFGGEQPHAEDIVRLCEDLSASRLPLTYS